MEQKYTWIEILCCRDSRISDANIELKYGIAAAST